MTCSWNTKRKVHYVLGTDNIDPQSGTALPFNYPNYAWLPFMCLYNPTASKFLDANIYTQQYEPKFNVRYNSVHYFSDS
eukprot:COSAG06_NODE_52910_length_303_cov_0.730392_1_plen_79_part_01